MGIKVINLNNNDVIDNAHLLIHTKNDTIRENSSLGTLEISIPKDNSTAEYLATIEKYFKENVFKIEMDGVNKDIYDKFINIHPVFQRIDLIMDVAVFKIVKCKRHSVLKSLDRDFTTSRFSYIDKYVKELSLDYKLSSSKQVYSIIQFANIKSVFISEKIFNIVDEIVLENDEFIYATRPNQFMFYRDSISNNLTNLKFEIVDTEGYANSLVVECDDGNESRLKVICWDNPSVSEKTIKEFGFDNKELKMIKAGDNEIYLAKSDNIN